jgi:hypothetical protein
LEDVLAALRTNPRDAKAQQRRRALLEQTRKRNGTSWSRGPAHPWVEPISAIDTSHTPETRDVSIL